MTRMGYARVTLSDGAGLSVYDHGQAGAPLLFIHGNSCDHTFLSPQIDHFSGLRRVVAPDLRGHGASDKPEGDYSPARLADDLAEMALALDLAPVVAVGHSLGGIVALELSLRHPRLVAGVACLDSSVLAVPGRPARLFSLLDGLRSPGWRSSFRRYFEAAFEPTDDPARKEAILTRMLGTPQHVVVSLFEQWRSFDGPAALRACRTPLLYVSSTRPRADAARLKELCPQLMCGQVVGSGHFLTLEVPEQVNAMLERFLAVNGL